MINPYHDNYEQVSIQGTPALFTMLRIEKDQLPENLYCYDVRHDNEGGKLPAEIKESVMINHMGSIITKEPIDLDENGSLILSDDDFEFTGQNNISLDDFIDDSYLQPKDRMDVVIVEPLREPYHTTIENTLTALQ